VGAMPAVAVVSLSTNPPLLGVSTHVGHSTTRLIVRSKCFSLNVLDKAQLGKVGKLAASSGKKGRDKLHEAGLAHRPGTATGSPVLEESVAWVECRLVRKLRFGDHRLVVGSIADAWASEDFSKYWRFKKYNPILYTGWRDGMTTLG
jgi:flavin reductase (DIM6/NTAB) family NADH-FMN oxidoreductase RutF